MIKYQNLYRKPSSLATGYDPLYSSSPLSSIRRIFVIPAHCQLLDFDSYAPCNDVIFSQSTRGFHFLSFECPENRLEIITGSVSSYKLLYE